MADNGEARRRTGRRWLWICAGIAAAGAVAAVLGIWHLPDRMYPGSGTEVVQAQAALQGGLLTAAAALTAVAGGLIALDEPRQANAEIRRANEAADTRERSANANTHVRELYIAAIGLLGADTVDGRLGGIYALERIAVDSPSQRTVVEVLSAFVRVHSTDPGLRSARRGTGEPPAPAVPLHQSGVDVHAAVTVLARLPVRSGVPRADLAGADLTSPALLDFHADGGNLMDVDLTAADLSYAQLREVDFSGARLVDADLTHARLHRANLSGARLHRADLTGARLKGANLTHARGLLQRQVDAAQGDGTTRLPEGLVRPAAWPARETAEV